MGFQICFDSGTTIWGVSVVCDGQGYKCGREGLGVKVWKRMGKCVVDGGRVLRMQLHKHHLAGKKGEDQLKSE